jgi:hypothetical protein
MIGLRYSTDFQFQNLNVGHAITAPQLPELRRGSARVDSGPRPRSPIAADRRRRRRRQRFNQNLNHKLDAAVVSTRDSNVFNSNSAVALHIAFLILGLGLRLHYSQASILETRRYQVMPLTDHTFPILDSKCRALLLLLKRKIESARGNRLQIMVARIQAW